MEELLCNVDNGVAVVVVNRPAQRNSMTLAMWRVIGELFWNLDADPAVRVIILTGAGEDFSSGADITEFAAIRDDTAQAVAYEEAVDYGCGAIANVGKPVIAAIKGYCLGGGAHLAMSCDFRYAHEEAVFGIPAARLSIVYGVEGTRKLLALVGVTQAKRIMYSAERFNAAHALSTGFVDRVSKAPREDAAEFASKLLANAPLSIRGAKYILTATALGTFDPKEADRLINAASASYDYREGRVAFAEKRPPRFEGK
ncbi:MAG: enoyl-CoA hydratase-related protein [Tepidamorphaceae bacterium]